jgi:hypothetical protein
MTGDSPDPIYVEARRVLFDGFNALGPHLEAIILVGAQAIYLHTGEAEFSLPPFTRDGDLVLDRALLADDPLIDALLREAHFLPSDGPGTWLSPEGVPLDLLVPEATAGPKARRSVHLDPHGRRTARRVVGLEAALVDNSSMRICALDPGDKRVFAIRVAGTAALVVAKCHKVGERLDQGRRVESKDAFDIFRLFQHTQTEQLASDITRLVLNDVAGPVTTDAIGYLRRYFSLSESEGCLLAQEAVGLLDPDGTVAPSVATLVQDLLLALDV